MQNLIIVLMLMNILVTLTAATSIKKRLDRNTNRLHDDIAIKAELLYIDIKRVDDKVSREKIRLAVKGEISDEISKLAFTPLKIDMRR